MMDNPDTTDTTARSDTPDRSVVDAALRLFSGNLTDDALVAHLKTLRADPHWRVFVLEGPKTRDVELIYKPTNAWYVLRLTKVWRLRGQVWRRTSHMTPPHERPCIAVIHATIHVKTAIQRALERNGCHRKGASVGR